MFILVFKYLKRIKYLLPATKLPLTSHHQMHLPCNAKHCTYPQQSCLLPRSAKRCTYLAMPSIALTCNKVAIFPRSAKRCTYLAMPSIALTCNKVASYLASPSDALTCNAPRCHTLQKPPPQSCPSHISTYHSPCVQPPVR